MKNKDSYLQLISQNPKFIANFMFKNTNRRYLPVLLVFLSNILCTARNSLYVGEISGISASFLLKLYYNPVLCLKTTIMLTLINIFFVFQSMILNIFQHQATIFFQTQKNSCGSNYLTGEVLSAKN